MDAALTLASLRGIAGSGSWASPKLAWRTFGIGQLDDDPRPALATRLFGVRDLALAMAIKHPSNEVRRAALRVGIAVDAIDVVASLIAVRKGAPRSTLLGVTAGAALFVALGVAALAADAPEPATA